MGIIVTEKTELDNGLYIDTYYASINTNDVKLKKQFTPDTPTPDSNVIVSTVFFIATATLNIWVSKEARDANKQSIKNDTVSITQETPISGNMYELLYAKYKEDHPNSVDA